MNIYIRQSKKNMKIIIIQLLHFVNLVMFLEQLIINGYTEKFLKVSKRIGLLLMRYKRFIQTHRIKAIEESEMIWNDIMVLM